MKKMHDQTLEKLSNLLITDRFTLSAIWELTGWEDEDRILNDKNHQTEFMQLWVSRTLDDFSQEQTVLIVAGRAIAASKPGWFGDPVTADYLCWGSEGEYAAQLKEQVFYCKKESYKYFIKVKDVNMWIDDYRQGREWTKKIPRVITDAENEIEGICQHK